MNAQYPDQLLDDYLAIEENSETRWDLLRHYEVDAFLLRWPQGDARAQALVDALYANPEWHLVYFDDACLLFERVALGQPGYAAICPGGTQQFRPGQLDAAENELAQRVAQGQPCRAASDLWIAVAIERHQPQQAIERADRHLHDEPEDAEAWLSRATARDRWATCRRRCTTSSKPCGCGRTRQWAALTPFARIPS